MKFILSILFIFSLFLSSVNKHISEGKSNQNDSLALWAISINHVPIVVADLAKIKTILSDSFGFKIKNGREHAGINNCFIKFQDGTYLEFTTPLDKSQSIGKYYFNFLKKRQGATSLAIDINSTDSAKHYLTLQNIPFTTDSNRIWKTLNPEIKNTDLFFIEYINKEWKDTKENTTQPNGSLGLTAVYFISQNVKEDIKKYCRLGFTLKKESAFLGTKTYLLQLGHSKLILIDKEKSAEITSKFATKNMDGICGFSIKVSSSINLRKLLRNTNKFIVQPYSSGKQLIVSIPEYNLFLEFKE